MVLAEQAVAGQSVGGQSGGAVRRSGGELYALAGLDQAAGEAESDGSGSEYRDQCGFPLRLGPAGTALPRCQLREV